MPILGSRPAAHLPDSPQRALDARDAFDIFAWTPEHPAEGFVGFDLADHLDLAYDDLTID